MFRQGVFIGILIGSIFPLLLSFHFSKTKEEYLMRKVAKYSKEVGRLLSHESAGLKKETEKKVYHLLNKLSSL